MRLTTASLILAAALSLTACQSSEEKAQGHFTSAQELAAAGDADRAIVELRNVFEYAPAHREARELLARLLLAKQDVAGAYGQLSLLFEQHPDAIDAAIGMAELALSQNDWQSFQSHTEAALRLDDARPDVKALQIALDYRRATEAQNATALDRLAAEAATLRATLPDNAALRRILIDRAMSGPAPADALPLIDEALAAQPVDYTLQEIKLRLLIEKDDPDAVVAHLRAMMTTFPQSETLPATLLQWLLSRNDIDGAEAFLKERAGAPDGPVEGHVALVEFQKSVRGADVALATLDSLISANAQTPNADLYTSLRASLRFEQGQTQEAIAETEAVLAKAQPSDQTRRIKILLARMLDESGDGIRARALIEEVISEDPAQVEALSMRAGWRVAEDRAGDAIVDLRAALGQNPEDPRLLMELATAYIRDGSLDLAGDALAQAVKASGGAPETALRYASFLQERGLETIAKTVLYDAWRTNPSNPDILESLAGIAVASQDWTLAREVSAMMRSFGNDAFTAAADQLDSTILIGQDRLEDGLALLETRASESSADNRWTALLVQAQIRSGKTADARRFLDEALARTPDDRDLRHQSAALDSLMGNNDAAISAYRLLLSEDPSDEVAIRSLYSLQVLTGATAEAEKTLADGLEVNPSSADLRWIHASALQEKGELEAALAIYEDLYAEESGNVIVANNLASLLSTLRTDPESIDRAHAVARRLRGTTVPAFQDTYGWLTFLKGEALEALPYLEAAAEGLPQDASVQYHLGKTYAALGRKDEAEARLERAIALAASGTPPFLDDARKSLADLRTATPEP